MPTFIVYYYLDDDYNLHHDTTHFKRKGVNYFRVLAHRDENNRFVMNSVQHPSFITAERLRSLRKGKGLSHEGLSKELRTRYDIKISSDSLQNYEVTDEHHTKAYKNQGMRIEFLMCLADFYNVSADYLLGRTDDSQRRPSVIDDLGLSEGAVLWLSALKNCQNPAVLAGANRIFANFYFHKLLYSIIGYDSAIKADKIYDSIRDDILSGITKSDLSGWSEDTWISMYTERYKEVFDEIDKIVQSGKYDDMVCDNLLLRKQLEETDLPNRSNVALWVDLFSSGAQDINGYRINKALSDLLHDIDKSVDVSCKD